MKDLKFVGHFEIFPVFTKFAKNGSGLKMKSAKMNNNIRMNKLVLFVILALAAKVHAEGKFLHMKGTLGEPAVGKPVLLGQDTKANCAPACLDGWPGDGYCDRVCWNAECEYDLGDCDCAPGCHQSWIGDG